MRWLALVALAGGSTAHAQPDIEARKPPVGAIAKPPCTVRAELVPVVASNRVSLKVVMKNSGSKPATFSLGASCGAIFTISGEPAVTCPPSPCRAAPTRTFTVGAHKSVVLGTTRISAKAGQCREPLPNGSTFFQAIVTTDPYEPTVCSGAQVHVIKDAKTGRLRKAALTAPIVSPSDPLAPSPSPSPVTKAKQCPACGIGCPHGRPSQKVDTNGCRECACEDLRPIAPANP